MNKLQGKLHSFSKPYFGVQHTKENDKRYCTIVQYNTFCEVHLNEIGKLFRCDILLFDTMMEAMECAKKWLGE